MYRVMVVDDERIIREGIGGAVPWETLEMELVALAEDGLDAQKKAKELRPDIVLTDIRMPRMGGLELIQYLKAHFPECKMIILTGHGEFEYARTALKLGVSDFLLKPVDLVGLCDVLEKVKQEIRAEQNQTEELTRLQKQELEEQTRRRNQALQRYITGKLPWESFEKEMPGAFHNKKHCAGVLVQIDDFDRHTGEMSEEAVFSFTQGLVDKLLEQVHKNEFLVEIESERYFIVFVGDDREELLFRMKLFVRRVRAAGIPVTFTTIMSSVMNHMASCRKCMEQTKACVDRVFLLGPEQDLWVEDAPEGLQASIPNDTIMRDIIQVLAEFQQDRIRDKLREIAQSIREAGHDSYLYTSMFVSFVYGETMKLLVEMHCPIRSIFPDPMKEYHKMMACQSLDSMIGELIRIVETICLFLQENAGAAQSAVEHARVYINEHYGNSKLTLDLVAKAVGISPTYLSALFKQKTQQSFVSYLTQTRLQHAQKLLQTGDYRTYEVAYMCGYDNATYFSTVFKRHMGVSPSSYRKG